MLCIFQVKGSAPVVMSAGYDSRIIGINDWSRPNSGLSSQIAWRRSYGFSLHNSNDKSLV